MVTKYCVGCHNTRNPMPAGMPLALDTANFADPGADAARWERVVKKLGVGAMPPQGSPTPGAAELTRFRTALITSLDAAAARKNNPGQYVLHRLNRLEYANAVRDLLGVTVDVTDLLPSDGGDFGFDNVATALKTSPLLIERYLTAGLKVSELAVGDAGAEPGTATFTIPTTVTQNEHVEGLPLGTRGGLVVPYTFPADGDYVFSGKLLKTVAEGLSGVEGQETPHIFIVTLDGKKVFSAPIGGKEDHDAAVSNKPVARELFDKRMTSPRITVTAGLHDVGFTFVERPTQEQNAWQPVLRATQEAHNPSGMPRLRNGIIEGPYNASGVTASASRQRLFVCTPTAAAPGSGVRGEDPHDRGATRVPASRHRRRHGSHARAVSRRAESGRRFRRRHSSGALEDPDQPRVPVPVGAGSGRPRRRRGASRSARSISPAACRSSSGAASRTTSC